MLVTRAREQASELVDRLKRLGAEAIELPAITIGEPDDGGAELAECASWLRRGDFEWVVFTSVNGVDRFCALLRDARDFGTTKVAAIALAFGQLSSAAWELAEAVERAQRQRRSRAG